MSEDLSIIVNSGLQRITNLVEQEKQESKERFDKLEVSLQTLTSNVNTLVVSEARYDEKFEHVRHHLSVQDNRLDHHSSEIETLSSHQSSNTTRHKINWWLVGSLITLISSIGYYLNDKVYETRQEMSELKVHIVTILNQELIAEKNRQDIIKIQENTNETKYILSQIKDKIEE